MSSLSDDRCLEYRRFLGLRRSFTDDADFVVFEGTHLKGRQQIASLTQQIFDTVWRTQNVDNAG
jgi:uncharacterized protein (TIGR02246 family)